MASLTVKEIPQEVFAELESRARRHGRSADAEALDLIQSTLADTGDFWRRADRLRASLQGCCFGSSTATIRAMRDHAS